MIREITPNQIANAIRDLLDENQQLKEQLKLVESLTCFNIPNNIPMVCMFKADYERNKYEYETLDKYKSILDEIREYIETKLRDVNLTYGIDNEFRQEYDDLLQILDKVKE